MKTRDESEGKNDQTENEDYGTIPGTIDPRQFIWDKLEFLSLKLDPRLSYEVAKTQPIIFLQCTRDLLAGLPREIELVISSGSVKITEDAKLKLSPELITL